RIRQDRQPRAGVRIGYRTALVGAGRQHDLLDAGREADVGDAELKIEGRAMRYFAMSLVWVLVFAVSAGFASAARSHRKASATCPGGRPRWVVADAQAQVYEAFESPNRPEVLGLFGCAYGREKSYLLGQPLE